MYTIHKFILTNSQLKKIKHALDEDKNISLKILDKNFHGNYPLPITDTEMKHINDGEAYVSILLSKKKLQHIRDQKEGGILPLIPIIISAIAAAGTAAGGASAIANAVHEKKLGEAKLEEARNNRAKLEEQAGHNREVENKLKSDKGIKTSEACYGRNSVGIAECPACGNGLILKAKKGKGLYLKPFSGSHTGLGILRSIDNSLPDTADFLKKLPIMGTLLNKSLEG